jgi:hypothetical protein
VLLLLLLLRSLHDIDMKAGRGPGEEVERMLDRQAGRQAGRQAVRQAGRQAVMAKRNDRSNEAAIAKVAASRSSVGSMCSRSVRG